MRNQNRLEPEYVDLDYDSKPKKKNNYKVNELDFKYPVLFEDMLALTGRTYIHSNEVTRCRQIDRKIYKNEIHPDWVEKCLQWPKVNDYVKFPMLLSYILNTAKYEDWLKEKGYAK